MTTVPQLLDQSFVCRTDAAIEAIGHAGSQFPVSALCGGRVNERNPGGARMHIVRNNARGLGTAIRGVKP